MRMIHRSAQERRSAQCIEYVSSCLLNDVDWKWQPKKHMGDKILKNDQREEKFIEKNDRAKYCRVVWESGKRNKMHPKAVIWGSLWNQNSCEIIWMKNLAHNERIGITYWTRQKLYFRHQHQARRLKIRSNRIGKRRENDKSCSGDEEQKSSHKYWHHIESYPHVSRDIIFFIGQSLANAIFLWLHFARMFSKFHQADP